ncbi:putative PetM of cytochrome b6/f complex subunit 7 [Tanacetum coccineum]
MATASASLCPATFASATVAPARSSGRATSTKVTYIKGLNSFGGLKAHNTVASLGTHACTEQQFANMVCAMKKKLPSSNKGGGALTSTCSAVAEIFRIAAIMNGLTLVGVAVGFVLLRIEASVEESAE